RHPPRRDRRQGRGHDAAARHRLLRQGRPAGPGQPDPDPDPERRRARAHQPLFPPQPARAAQSGLAPHGHEPEPEPRLHEAGSGRDAGRHGPDPQVSAGPLRRHPRHRRHRLSIRRHLRLQRRGRRLEPQPGHRQMAGRRLQARHVRGAGGSRAHPRRTDLRHRRPRSEEGPERRRSGRALLQRLGLGGPHPDHIDREPQPEAARTAG
uniref:Endopeptidase Clp n=1 Tax=Parastrongyloides trichosuri TaxID=131310 RepID=A0A0N5A0T5_PARTI